MSRKELREFTRVKLTVQAEGELKSAKPLKGVIENLSATGLFLTIPTPPEEGSVYEIVIRFLKDFDAEPVHLQVRCVRVEESGAAFSFKSVAVESFETLKQLILYSAEKGDEARILREFTSHFGIRHGLDE